MKLKKIIDYLDYLADIELRDEYDGLVYVGDKFQMPKKYLNYKIYLSEEYSSIYANSYINRFGVKVDKFVIYVKKGKGKKKKK